MQFCELMRTLCAENCVLALITRLLCVRDHGTSGCALVPLGIDENPNLKDGTPCPMGVFRGEDLQSFLYALTGILKRELEQINSEVRYLNQHGVRLDGSSAATADWIEDTITNNKTLTEAGVSLAPTNDTKLRLAVLGTQSRDLFKRYKTREPQLPTFGRKVSPLAVRVAVVRLPADPKARRSVKF
jgi:hypothetical protein